MLETCLRSLNKDMARSHFIFESVLMAITLYFGIGLNFNTDVSMGALIWLAILGILQVVHSLGLALGYWKNKSIRSAVIIYWVGVLSFFGIIYLMFRNGYIVPEFIWLILALLLALYLWAITWIF